MNSETESMESKNRTEEAAGISSKKDDFLKTGAEVYAQTEQAVTEAYDKTAKAAGETYEQAKSFGRENPEKLALIAFGVGVGVGLLLGSRRSRSGRYVQPLVDAAYDIAVAFLR
jgi:ElaB/YqjD/DUF883 family membrane-anchored ribosome-binding protein